jgi:hypothetical protein
VFHSHFDENGSEGEHAGEGDDDERRRVPRAGGDRARDGVDAAREVSLAPQVAPDQGAAHHERQGHEEPNSEYLDECALVHHVGRVVVPAETKAREHP